MRSKDRIYLLVTEPMNDVAIEEGAKAEVTAWNSNKPDAQMIDDHITEHYPEIMDELPGLEELQEGYMVYDGDLELDAIRVALFNLGFQIRTTLPNNIYAQE